MEQTQKASREKYWSELTDMEKIERLRKEIKFLKSLNGSLIGDNRKLLQHKHLPNGDICVEIRNSDGYLLGESLSPLGENKDDVYI